MEIACPNGIWQQQKKKALKLDYEGAREIIYGMPYEEWKDKHQSKASPEQISAFRESQKD